MSETDMHPIPVTAESKRFWDGCARGELLYAQCADCHRPQFYPRAHCVHCQGRNLEWKRSNATGTLHTFTTVHRAPSAAFRSEAPYVIALVDLDEGFRMMMNVSNAEAELSIGQRVSVTFKNLANGDVLPVASLRLKVRL